MTHSETDHLINHRFQPFGHKGLQHMAFNRQPHSSHRRHLTRPSGHDDRNLLGTDRPARGLHAARNPVFNVDTGNFAVLDQIDAARIYAVEQVITQYGAALTEVTTKQQIKLVVDPTTLLFAVPEADITQQITTALNAKVPSVGIVPPQGWQPARESVQLYQEIQQRLVTAQMIQQRQQQQQAGNPQAPTGR